MKVLTNRLSITSHELFSCFIKWKKQKFRAYTIHTVIRHKHCVYALMWDSEFISQVTLKVNIKTNKAVIYDTDNVINLLRYYKYKKYLNDYYRSDRWANALLNKK